MSRLTLRYGEDPTTGLPRLDSPERELSTEDLDVLCRAIEPSYERLASGPDGQLVTLDHVDHPALPQHYRVIVTERGKRCPTLQLEEADPAVSDDAPDAENNTPVVPLPGRWQAQFLAEAAEWLSRIPADGADRSPLDFVLADLRALLRKDAKRFILLLFAGYLHVGDTLSRRHGELGENPYVRAAENLVRQTGDALPDGVFDSLQHDRLHSRSLSEPAEEARSWWRSFFSLS